MFDPTKASRGGIFPGALAMAAVGALVMSGERSTGSIGTTRRVAMKIAIGKGTGRDPRSAN
jgi:hypothetical protein